MLWGLLPPRPGLGPLALALGPSCIRCPGAGSQARGAGGPVERKPRLLEVEEQLPAPPWPPRQGCLEVSTAALWGGLSTGGRAPQGCGVWALPRSCPAASTPPRRAEGRQEACSQWLSGVRGSRSEGQRREVRRQQSATLAAVSGAWRAHLCRAGRGRVCGWRSAGHPHTRPDCWAQDRGATWPQGVARRRCGLAAPRSGALRRGSSAFSWPQSQVEATPLNPGGRSGPAHTVGTLLGRPAGVWAHPAAGWRAWSRGPRAAPPEAVAGHCFWLQEALGCRLAVCALPERARACLSVPECANPCAACRCHASV